MDQPAVAVHSENDWKNKKNANQEEQRKALIERLESEGAYDLTKPLNNCGLSLPLTCTGCGSIHETVTHCMARYCPSCQPLVAVERVNRWNHAIESIKWPLFVTLTIPNSEDPEQLRFLKDRWSKFRRRKIISTKVRGGVATFEVTNKGNGWHPHLHSIMDCRWLAVHTPEPHWNDSATVKASKCRQAQEELSAAWADMIGEETGIVWIRRVYGNGIIKEVMKYAAKGSELIESPDAIAPMLRVLKSTRTLAGWGSMYPLPPLDEEEAPKVGCEGCGAIRSFIPSEIAWTMGRRDLPPPGGRTVPPPKQE